MNREEIKEALLALKFNKKHLTFQEFRTLRGQIKAGQIEAFYKGLENIKSRKYKKVRVSR